MVNFLQNAQESTHVQKSVLTLQNISGGIVMTRPNRSVLRSKNMLRKAYIELSTEKDASKITVVDVVNRADLSRNTFYAHYPDVNAIA